MSILDRNSAGCAVVLLMLVMSCTSAHDVPVSQVTKPVVPAGHDPVRITGYTTRDGAFHRFEGTVRADGDSLEFFAPAQKGKGLAVARPETQLRLAADDVDSVKYFSANILGSVLFAAFVVVVGTFVYYYGGFSD